MRVNVSQAHNEVQARRWRRGGGGEDGDGGYRAGGDAVVGKRTLKAVSLTGIRAVESFSDPAACQGDLGT